MTAPTADADKNTWTVQQVVDQVDTLSDAHISRAIEALQTEAKPLQDKRKAGEPLSGDERDTLSQYAEQAKTLKDARRTRAEQRAADDEAFGAILDDDESEEAEPAEDEAEGSDEETEETEDDAAEGDSDGEAEAAGDGGQAQPVAASAGKPAKTPATTKPRSLSLGEINPTEGSNGSPKATSEQRTATITAGAGSRKARDSEIDVKQLLLDMSDASKNEWGGGGQVVVASIEAARDETRHLKAEAGADRNAKIIDKTLHPNGGAITAAAGGFGPTGGGAPFQVYFNVDVAGSTERPVQASLAHFTADRGGLQFRQDMDPFGGSEITASGTWTNAMDADPDNSTPKPIYDVPLLPVVQAQVRAVTQGLRLSNMSAKFDPEATAAHLKAVDICHARYAESLLLADMYAAATAQWAYSINPNLGLTRNLMEFFDKTAAYLRDIQRLDSSVQLQVYLPRWLREAIRSDMTRALHTANMDWIQLSDAAIDQFLTNRNITPVWLMEGRGAQAQSGASGTLVPATPSQQYTRMTGGSATTPGFPTSLEFLMAPAGTYVYLDGGSLDVGVIRDQQLVQKNRYVQFQETFEGVYRKGLSAVRGVIPVNLRGGSAGTIDATALANA